MNFKQQINDYIQSHKKEIVDTLNELIKIPSVRGNAEENAPFGKECARVLDFTKTLYERNGFEAEPKINKQPRFSYCFDHVLSKIPTELSEKIMVQNPMRMLACK